MRESNGSRDACGPSLGALRGRHPGEEKFLSTAREGVVVFEGEEVGLECCGEVCGHLKILGSVEGGLGAVGDGRVDHGLARGLLEAAALEQGDAALVERGPDTSGPARGDTDHCAALIKPAR